MKVILFDRSEYVISDAQARKLQKALADGSSGWVTIQGATIRKTAIAVVKPGGYSEADVVKATDAARLKPDNRSDTDQRRAARKQAESIRKIIKTKGLGGLKK